MLLALGGPSQATALPEVDGCTEVMYQDRTASGADRELRWDFNFAADPCWRSGHAASVLTP
jgi:hypothetical protein